MAITHLGAENNLPAVQLPTGYVKPNIATFEDYEYPRTLILEVLKATVENANPAVTMANIIDNATIGIDKQVEDILAADFLGTATVLSFASLTALNTNFADLKSTADYLKTTAAKYICTVKIFIKVS